MTGAPGAAPPSAGPVGEVAGEVAVDPYDHAPSGHLSTTPDGRIVAINNTLLAWTGRARADVVGRLRLADLVTVGGRLYLETHVEPLLRMHGEVNGIALELRAATGDRLPVLLTATVSPDAAGRPALFRVTVFDARERRAYEQELLRARRDAERQRDEVQRLATTLQQTLLPPTLPDVPGAEVAALYHHASADQVGGDFYDLFPLAGGDWGLFLGDVCGKGADAAAITSLTRYTLRAAAVYDPDPAAVLTNLNTVLHQELAGVSHRFCTVVFGVLRRDGDGHRITVASGGHPPALLLRASGELEQLRTPRGQLIGVLPNATIVTATARLGPGDTVVLCTDGLIEARTGDDRRFEDESWHAFAEALAPSTAPAVIDAIGTLLAGFGDGLEDDVAALALSILPAG